MTYIRIIPNEYGSDNDNAYLSSTIPVMREKKAARDRVEEKAKELNKAAKWIGVITNPWYDFVSSSSYYLSISIATGVLTRL